jgi:hypothetical protein
MRSSKTTFLDQARLSRDRAGFYRELARKLEHSPVSEELERYACELEIRAGEIERFAGRPVDPRRDLGMGGVRRGGGESQSGGANPVVELQLALRLAFPDRHE